MEINKVVKKSLKFTKELEDAFEKDIVLLIDYITNNFEIYDKSNKKLKKDDVLENINNNFYKKNSITCYAITKSGVRCTRKCYPSMDGKNYCKTHINNAYKYNNSNKTNNTNNLYNNCENDTVYVLENKHEMLHKNFIKKFINDEFYYIDDKFIYDNSYNKCGYIHNDTDNKLDVEYIFTDDPFILEEF